MTDVQTQTTPAVTRAEPTPSRISLPESRSYRLKNRLLGPPLHTEQLAHERLGKPTALAVFASDNLSSSAYATEEILRVLVPAVGLGAFALVVPVTVALLVVLGLLILSYRQTIKEYPTAGGAYIVTKDNWGLLPAQVAGVALLTDYVLTVAVSVAAGTAALASAFSAFAPYTLMISIGFVVLIAYGNLRGVKESGRIFSVPTYFFIIDMVVLLVWGFIRMVGGHLPVDTLHHAGLVKPGLAGNGIFEGAALFVVLHAFASGGAAVTGVEAISNGVTAFREPAWKNARTTLVIMGTTLGAMFLGLSILAAKLHTAPYEKGTPTVISQVGKLVYGTTPLGHAMFLALQAGTMLILVLAANTSFADFPRLASFHAGDNFMPRQLTKRGHRLVFSNGIISLAAAAVVLLVVTDAKVDRLIPLYAIGVFTSFTMSQSGMAKHHVTHKEPGWRRGLVINATGAFLSAVVDIIIAVTKFTEGAWVVIALVPIMVAALVRLNRQYESEVEELESDAPRAAEAPILPRHVVLIMIDSLDMAAARAIQYGRSLRPDELRAVHVDLDPIRTEDLTAFWQRLGLSSIPLDVIECPDRRIAQTAAEVVAEELVDGHTEVSVLLPRREYLRIWHRLLHDRTADQLASTLARFPHCNVTVVPYHLGYGEVPDTPEDVLRVAQSSAAQRTADGNGAGQGAPGLAGEPAVPLPPGCAPIASIHYRQHVTVGGRVKALRVQPRAGIPTLECTIDDGTGALVVVFLGRRQIGGLTTGTRLVVEGRISEHHARWAILNPTYEIIPSLEPEPGHEASAH